MFHRPCKRKTPVSSPVNVLLTQLASSVKKLLISATVLLVRMMVNVVRSHSRSPHVLVRRATMDNGAKRKGLNASTILVKMAEDVSIN